MKKLLSLTRDYFSGVPKATFVLSLGQAVNLTCLVISVTVAALVGLKLAPNAAMATLPYGIQQLAILVCTYPASQLMQKFGRKTIFYGAAGILAAAGITGYNAITLQNFMLLIGAHALIGIYAACANYYRFAAVDNLPNHIKPQAISLVVAGGLLAALCGPFVANLTKNLPGFTEFSAVYGSFTVFAVLTVILMRIWQPYTAPPQTQTQDQTETQPQYNGRLAIVAAIFCGASGYFIMNLIMVQSTLTMNHHYSFAMNSHAIQMHVFGMFVPSLFAGYLMTKIGIPKGLSMGFFMLIAAAFIVQIGIIYSVIYVSLILLGVGWCFSYVGGAALLTASTSEAKRHRLQGINEFCIALGATLGAFLPAPLLELLGWQLSNMIVVPICMVSLLFIWRVSRGERVASEVRV